MFDNLFCSVGAMKAGTTWLHHQLSGHPEIFFTPEKEVHYLSDPTGHFGAMRLSNRVARFQQVVSNLSALSINPHVRRNLRWYINKYLAQKVSNDWYIGLFDHKGSETYVADFSNLYCILDEAGWQNARQCARNIKVLYTMRSPVERLWSHVKFHHQLRDDFAYSEQTKTDWERLASHAGILQYSDYKEAITRLRASHDASELLFQFFEDVRSDPLQALSEIEVFLGIAPWSYKDARLHSIVNATPSVPIPTAFYDYAMPQHERQMNELSALGFDLPLSWQSPN